APAGDPPLAPSADRQAAQGSPANRDQSEGYSANGNPAHRDSPHSEQNTASCITDGNPTLGLLPPQAGAFTKRDMHQRPAEQDDFRAILERCLFLGFSSAELGCSPTLPGRFFLPNLLLPAVRSKTQRRN